MLEAIFAHPHALANHMLKISHDFLDRCLRFEKLKSWREITVVLIVLRPRNHAYRIPFIPKLPKRHNSGLVCAHLSGHSMRFNVGVDRHATALRRKEQAYQHGLRRNAVAYPCRMTC